MEFIFSHPDKASWLEKALDPMLRELVISDKKLQAFMSDAEHLYWTPTNIERLRRSFPSALMEQSPPGRPDFNGRIERAMRRLVSNTRTVMIEAAHLSHQCFESAMIYCVQQHNRSATTNSDLTPIERWTGRRPSYAKTVPFGIPAYVRLQPQERTGPTTRLQSVARQVSILREAPDGRPGY